jgi:hypothetical protein
MIESLVSSRGSVEYNTLPWLPKDLLPIPIVQSVLWADTMIPQKAAVGRQAKLEVRNLAAKKSPEKCEAD